MAYEIKNTGLGGNSARNANVDNGVNASRQPNTSRDASVDRNANQPNLWRGLSAECAVGAEAPILQPRILIADDQADVLEALRALLKNNGYKCELASSPGAIVEAITAREFDVILMDLNYARDTTSGREGLDVLARVRGSANGASIVVMTGWATVEPGG
jgi:CheY-like chemotaxis protein